MRKLLPEGADSSDAQIASFRHVGLSVADGFQWQTLDEPTWRGLARAIKVGAQIIDKKWEAAGEVAHGWKYTFAGGRAGYDPGLRAALIKFKGGAQLSDQVIYPNTNVDDKGERLTGSRKYVLLRCRKPAAGGDVLEPGDVRRRHAVRGKRVRPLQLRQHHGRHEKERQRLARYYHPRPTSRLTPPTGCLRPRVSST